MPQSSRGNARAIAKIIASNNKLIAEASKKYLSRSTSARFPDYIPTDPDEFYRDFGLLSHPDTDQPVEHLTDYQYEAWRLSRDYQYRMIIKAQKIGMSTSTLMEDFQKAITTCKGKEILIIAQSFLHAKNHLYTLRKMILDSPKYSPYLLSKPDSTMLRDEVSKASTLFIANPENPKQKTRIIALGPKPGGIWSWKNVKHIHVSDITVQQLMVDDSETFGAMFSRLANTNGSIIIESPPRGPSGKVYEIYEQSKLYEKMRIKNETLGIKSRPGEANTKTKLNPMSNFAIREYPVSLAVKAGLVTEEFLAGEKIKYGPMYSMYYECDFFNAANVWYKKDMFNYGDYDLE